jgi:hypothetical protein
MTIFDFLGWLFVLGVFQLLTAIAFVAFFFVALAVGKMARWFAYNRYRRY